VTRYRVRIRADDIREDAGSYAGWCVVAQSGAQGDEATTRHMREPRMRKTALPEGVRVERAHRRAPTRTALSRYRAVAYRRSILAVAGTNELTTLRARLQRSCTFGTAFALAWPAALDACPLAPLERAAVKDTRETWARAYERQPPTPADHTAARFGAAFDRSG
jgi:hypothetical protein